MSIVALKRRAAHIQFPISSTHFSLAGNHRNQRVFGNTNLSSLSSNSSCCYINPDTSPLSTKNTSGYLLSTVIYPTCKEGITPNAAYFTNKNMVKIISPLNKSQESYINKKRSEVSACDIKKTVIADITPPECKCIITQYHIGGRKIYRVKNEKPTEIYVKTTPTASEYTSSALLLKNCLPLSASMNLKPVAILDGGCNYK